MCRFWAGFRGGRIECKSQSAPKIGGHPKATVSWHHLTIFRRREKSAVSLAADFRGVFWQCIFASLPQKLLVNGPSAADILEPDFSPAADFFRGSSPICFIVSLCLNPMSSYLCHLPLTSLSISPFQQRRTSPMRPPRLPGGQEPWEEPMEEGDGIGEALRLSLELTEYVGLVRAPEGTQPTCPAVVSILQ